VQREQFKPSGIIKYLIAMMEGQKSNMFLANPQGNEILL
jgi:hypothetical protein